MIEYKWNIKVIKSKRLVVIILLIFTLSVLNSQNLKYYYYYTEAQIKENTELNRHETCQVLALEDSEFILGTVIAFYHNGIIPTGFDCISIGKYKFINDILYCYDKNLNRTYKFKQLDFYTLEALNHTAVFVKGDKIYLHLCNSDTFGYSAFYELDDLIQSDYWKTGVKDGIHVKYENDTKILYYYQNNILVDSVSINCSMYKPNYECIVKEVLFVVQYGNKHNFSNYYYNDLNLILCDYNYLLIKEKDVISAGKFETVYTKSYRKEDGFLINCQDIEEKYEFTFLEKDDLLTVSCFKNNLSDEAVVLNVGDKFLTMP